MEVKYIHVCKCNIIKIATFIFKQRLFLVYYNFPVPVSLTDICS